MNTATPQREPIRFFITCDPAGYTLGQMLFMKRRTNKTKSPYSTVVEIAANGIWCEPMDAHGYNRQQRRIAYKQQKCKHDNPRNVKNGNPFVCVSCGLNIRP